MRHNSGPKVDLFYHLKDFYSKKMRHNSGPIVDLSYQLKQIYSEIATHFGSKSGLSNFRFRVFDDQRDVDRDDRRDTDREDR